TNTIALTTLNMGVLFLARFTQSFLRTDQQAPRFDVLLSLLAFTALGCALLGLALPFAATLRVSILLLMLTVAVQMTITVILSLKGQRPARFFLLAWVSSFVGIPISTAYFAGAISGDTLAANASRISTVIGVILFSLALADRFNLERRERMRLGRLKRFFSPQVAAAILEESEEALLAPKRRDVTVVFTDLRGFTEFSANSEPEEVIQVLREYHQVVGNTVAKHHGTLEHFAGDGVMVYFNAPLEIDDPEGSAMRMAFELRDQFEKLCQEWRRRGHSLGIGIGMASGYATVGAVGFEGRRDYAAIGTVTNLAARLCSQAEHGRILVSQRLFTKIEGLVEAENLGEREVKGMPKPIAVYSLTQLKAA
ncbi:MAG: adenylate/guanylate cyclase domain-containing protein, partial [Nevskiales bacterium]